MYLIVYGIVMKRLNNNSNTEKSLIRAIRYGSTLRGTDHN